MIYKFNKPYDEFGFTVLELMIATTVFTMVLLLCTFGIIEIGKNYYKGATIARTQNITRGLMDDITQAIQFGSSAPSPGNFELTDWLRPPNPPSALNSGQICIGNKIYKINLGLPVSSSTYAIKVAKAKNGCIQDGTNETELLGKNMRLTKFKIEKTDSDYAVTIKVIYGDDDLIIDDSNVDATNTASFVKSQAKCRGGTGSQFCASSELTTTVTRRVN